MSSSASALVLAMTTAGAAAQAIHQSDMVIRWSGEGTIESGLPAGDQSVLWGEQIVAGRLDTGQFANLADDPGFDSSSGAFPVGTGIGLDLIASLRLWDGDDFDTIDPDFAMSVTKGDDIITTSGDDSRVTGFQFGSADANGRFHHHVRFFIDPFDAFNAVPGLWMLTLELWSTNPLVLPSEPVYVVFSSGSEALAEREAAIAWIENNLIAGPCNAADLADPEGVLDLADITAFVGAFTAGEAPADLAEPFGVFDLSDLVAFIDSFTTGCP